MKKFTTAAIILILVLATLLCSCTKSSENEDETANTDNSWVITESNVLQGPNNFKAQLDGNFKVIAFNAKRVVMIDQSKHQLCVADSNTKTMHAVSNDQIVVDYYIDANIIYWINDNNKVWMADWTSSVNQSRRYDGDTNHLPFNN